MIIVVVGCGGIVGIEMVGAGDFRALVGMVSFLLALVARNVIQKPAVSSRGCLDKCHSVGCCVAGVPVVPVAPVVLVVRDEASATVEHCCPPFQSNGFSMANSHGNFSA